MLQRWVLCGLLTIHAVGCATNGHAGDWSLPAHPPTATAARSDRSVAAPDPAATSRVSLAQILAYASHHAPAIHVGLARLTTGDAEVTAALPLLPDDPDISVSAGPRYSAGGRAFDVEVSIQQRIQIAGERGLRIEAARRLRDRLHAEVAQVRWRVHRLIHAAYRVAQVARERKRAADRLLAFAERLLSIARRRESAGAISGLQVEVVKGELAQARQAKIAGDNVYRAARLTLAEISAMRGVDSTHALKTLLLKRLVKITGRKKSPGKPLIYRTSNKFLCSFGLNSLKDLPTTEEIEKILEEEQPHE